MDQKRSIETRLKGVGILRRTTRYLLVTMLAVLASATALQAQNTVIKGVVTDKGGAPIAGVTVVAKGTTAGEVTSSDGSYTLSVPAGAEVLQFSFIGMETQEVAIGSRTEINVTMAPGSLGIDEVVVVGYGTLAKRDLSSSVASVKNEDLTERTTAFNIMQGIAGKVAGVKFVDNTTGEEYSIKARSVVNAAGCFVDDIMHMDSPEHRKMVTPSQGVHLVLDMKFLQSDYAIMVPKTSDGRVLFAVPWHDKVVVGTTDIVRPTPEEEPRPLKEEIDFILGTAGLYMNPAPTYKDILSVFAGQRPLAAPKKEGKNTKEISRSHKVITSDNGLVTITGGKWTSYRLMAEDTVDKAIEVAGLPRRKCVTKKFHIHGYRKNPNLADHMYVYGSDEPKILNLIKENPALGEKLSPKFGYTLAEVVWAVREEMALTVEDVLARRVRLLFVDAREAMAAAPKVAETMARELGRDQAWIDAQVESFTKMAKNYIFEA